MTPRLSAALDLVGRALVEHRSEQEALASRLAAHRAAGVDVGLRLASLSTRARRMERPAHDATEQSLITMGLARPRKATS